MGVQGIIVASLMLSCLAATSYAVTFSSILNTLVVSASTTQEQVVRAGEDNITLTWSLNTTFPPGTDSAYSTVEFSLCYAPVSQNDRGWRRTHDDLEKDKTCQHKIVSRPYTASNNNFTWTVAKDVPTATYFIRGYVLNSLNEEVAFGQTTDSNKVTNLFDVHGVSGRHASLDIASICFSAFAVVSLFGFFFFEKKRNKSNQQK